MSYLTNEWHLILAALACFVSAMTVVVAAVALHVRDHRRRHR